MDLRHLRTFVAVAKEGSVSRAAERLFVTQPAVSRHIAEFERELGVAVLERVGRGIRLSPSGAALVAMSRDILARVESLKQHAARIAAGEAGLLRVGTTPQVIEGILSEALRSFRPAHPEVEVRVTEAGGILALDLLEQGAIDLAIGPSTLAREFPLQPLGHCPILAVMEESHPLLTRRQLNVTDLRGERIILLDETFITRDMFLAACHASRIRPHIQFQSGSPHSLLAMAECGEGIAILPATTQIGTRRLKHRPLIHEGRPLGFELSAVFDPLRSLSTPAQDLIDNFREVIERGILVQASG